MNNKKYWVFFEPHTYIEVNDNSVLIYDTLENLFFTYHDTPRLADFVNNMIQDGALKLDEDYILNGEFSSLINTWRESFLCDYIDTLISTQKPVVFDSKVSFLDETNIQKKQFSTDSGKYLKEVTIELNSHEAVLSFDSIKTILSQLKSTDCATVFLTGENPLIHEKFKSIIESINYEGYKCKILIDINNIIGNIHLLDHKLFETIILIKASVLNKKLEIITDIFSQVKKEILFRFTFTSLNEYNTIGQFINNMKIKKSQIIPEYDNINRDFFEDNFRITEKSILSKKFVLQDLYVNRNINRNYWGKLNISAAGDIFSSNKNSILGNIGTETIKESIKSELQSANAWLKVRKNLKPCNKCIYMSFCPPLSSYEEKLGEAGFCTVKNRNMKKVI